MRLLCLPHPSQNRKSLPCLLSSYPWHLGLSPACSQQLSQQNMEADKSRVPQPQIVSWLAWLSPLTNQPVVMVSEWGEQAAGSSQLSTQMNKFISRLSTGPHSPTLAHASLDTP